MRYVWIVPAAVGGEWVLKDDRGMLSGTLNLVQRYQRVGGTLALGGKTQPLLGASMDGDKLGFSFIDRDEQPANRPDEGRRISDDRRAVRHSGRPQLTGSKR